MSKLKQNKIYLTLEEEHTVAEDSALFSWKLVRTRDSLIKCSESVGWIEWNTDARFKEKHEEPSIGYSLIMSPLSFTYTWLTTPIVEIISKTDNLVHFKTQNSEYYLTKEFVEKI